VARTLSASRVRVQAGAEAEYLASVRELARLAEARGWHLWVFRKPNEAGTYLEFSESRSRDTHRAVAPRPPDEQALEARIRALAEYAPDAWELWEEVR
jgi:hypothetical protein